MKQAMLFAAAVAAAFTTGRAAAQPAAGPPVIRVSATGEVRATPDQAMADFAVESVAATAQEAAAQNAQAMERVFAALVRAGVPRDRIETRDYSVFPDYDHREGSEPRIRGYRVNNTVQATLYDVDRVGAVIDAALAGGANRVNGVRFGLRDPQAHRQRAIAEAVRRARADAESLADALGMGLGSMREAGTVEAGPVFPVMMEARMQMADAGGAPTPVSPGEQVVRATVTVVYNVTGRGS